MECKKVILTFILLPLLGFTGLQAQNSLYINEKSGNKSSYALADIRKLTFAAGNLSVSITDGNIDSYDLNSMRYMSFKDFTTDGIPAVLKESSCITIYPNPVNELLQIIYESPGAGNVRVTIIDMLGEVLIQQNLTSQPGINHAIISAGLLSCGLYICLIQNGNKTETGKFIKNE